MVDGTTPIKELNSAKVGLLSARFHALAIITLFALTLGPSEVLSIRESHNLRDSNSLKGTDIKEKDNNKDKTGQNRAWDRKEREYTSPAVPSDFIGPARNPFYGPGQPILS
ncbi:hypothetical protein Tco_1068444 [Tanacetum coccineum]|uniref:Uncharacterized protein n=1 Tax=Tanacetum coccineum TaxID=301880 RepID=A0ABQ5HHH9_9ASTR